ncbi:MAG: SDR family oxidoreductase [Taibaiella sp.]|nr:SDR family oxidoreductase [Taibaiella sp.]
MNRKIALVTGGSRGLGKEMAKSLAARGLDVIITYNTGKEGAEQVATAVEAAGGKCGILQLNMANPGGLNNFVSDLQQLLLQKWNTTNIDFLINNAGIGATVPMAQVTEELFDNMLNIHYKGVYFLTQKLLPMMNDNGGVIFISSGTTRFCVPGYSVYASLKGAIEVLAKYVAKENGIRGIRSNVVAPGPIETDFNNAAIRNNPQMKTVLSGLSPLGRVGMADDIGGVVAFLCTDDARWINNQRIEVSGGINT